MYKCYSDINGNMPCDNGCMCDKCMYEDVEIIGYEEEETPPFPENWNILTAIEYYMDCGMDEETATLMADIEFGIDYEEVE